LSFNRKRAIGYRMNEIINYIDLLDRSARLAGDRAALIDDAGSLTHSELAAQTNQLANTLIGKAFNPETPFAVLSPNTNLAMVSIIGGIKAGGAWSNLNLRSGAAVNADLLDRGHCQVLFFHSSIIDQIHEIDRVVNSLEYIICLDTEIQGYPSFAQFIAGAETTSVNIHLLSTQVGFQGSTGGTTGAPKITQAGQAFVTCCALGFMTMLTEFDIDRPPINLAVAPITHAGGFVALSSLAFGGTVMMMATTDPEAILLNIQQHQISLIFLPPTLTYVLMNHPQCSKTDFSSLRYLVSAAAPFAVEKIARAHEVFGPVICQAYGQTESGFPLTFMSPSAMTSALQDEVLSARLHSVGRPTIVAGEMEVVDEDGQLLGPDEMGEIAIHGPMVMHRYLNDPEATAAIQTNGWQHTGDLGYRDKDGFIYINDRKRDLIISGGFNVFPLDVEQALLKHPAVQDCAVIGVPDDKWGEAVKAVVELAPGQSVSDSELIAICKENLGSVMAPKSIDFIAELPRSPVGKVLKRELRKSYWRDVKQAI